jgi:molybdopterin biosynthesis enzyme
MLPFLTPVAEALDLAFSRISPPCPIAIHTEDALGRILAAPLASSVPLPVRSVALRSGLAVAAFDTIGASDHTPVPLFHSAVPVRAGDALPTGFDAVIPSEAAVETGPVPAIAQGAAPGEGVRLAGHDLAAGSSIGDRGAIVTPQLQLVLREAGIRVVNVICPRIGIGSGPKAARAWLCAELGARGCLVSGAGMENVHCRVNWANEAEPRLACNPGQTAFVTVDADGLAEMNLPRRFDGLVAAFFLLVLPVIHRLTGSKSPSTARPLRRKIASTIGFTDVVLLQHEDEGYLPLCVGEITLAGLASADAIASIPPESEGLPVGAALTATPLNIVFAPAKVS